MKNQYITWRDLENHLSVSNEEMYGLMNKIERETKVFQNLGNLVPDTILNDLQIFRRTWK